MNKTISPALLLNALPAGAESVGIPSSVEKSAEEKGEYLHPEVVGKSGDLSIYGPWETPEGE